MKQTFKNKSNVLFLFKYLHYIDKYIKVRVISIPYLIFPVNNSYSKSWLHNWYSFLTMSH